MITSLQFKGLPYLLRRRHLVGCGIQEKSLRWLVRDQAIACVRPGGEAGYRLFLKSSVAPLLGFEVDWSEFESWPALLTRYHLLQAGLHDEDVGGLVRGGVLRTLRGHGATRYYRCEVGRLIGRVAEVRTLGKGNLTTEAQSHRD